MNDTPGGLRAGTSYDFQALRGPGVEAGTVLDWQGDAKLTIRPDPWPVLTVEVEPAGSGCASCTLRLLPGRGEGRVDSVATVGGWSYPLPAAEAEFQLCL